MFVKTNFCSTSKPKNLSNTSRANDQVISSNKKMTRLWKRGLLQSYCYMNHGTLNKMHAPHATSVSEPRTTLSLCLWLPLLSIWNCSKGSAHSTAHVLQMFAANGTRLLDHQEHHSERRQNCQLARCRAESGASFWGRIPSATTSTETSSGHSSSSHWDACGTRWQYNPSCGLQMASFILQNNCDVINVIDVVMHITRFSLQYDF